jgi:hypothetical protein
LDIYLTEGEYDNDMSWNDRAAVPPLLIHSR